MGTSGWCKASTSRSMVSRQASETAGRQMQCAGLAEVSRLHVDRTLDPQIGNVDISGLAPECATRVGAAVFRFIASAAEAGRLHCALRPRRAGRRGREVLGNHVNDLTLPLHLAATP